jgi:alpha-tubulin suppressor-like RCC1 family protein
MLAVKTDGTLWSWGWNSDGQLGNGNTTQICSPVQVGSLTDWSSERGKFVTDSSASFAIKTDGTLWSWGDKGSGHLGLNDMTSRSSPTQVGSLTDWAWIHSSQPTSGVVKTDGTLWTWGGATNGQLGNGTDSGDISSPIQIGSLTLWDDVNTIQEAGSAIKTDGTLWTWGANSQGECGNGGTTATSSPAQVGSLTDWVDLTGAFQCGFASRSA